MSSFIDFANTEYGKFGLEFAFALAGGSYDVAHEMLTDELRRSWSPVRIQQTFEQMIQHGVVTGIAALDGSDKFPDDDARDIGGVYISISGHVQGEPLLTYNEAVMVHVRREQHGLRIRKLTWGRP